MVRTLKNCLQLSLKVFNSITGMAGVAMITYGLLLIRVWQGHSSEDDQTSLPWFIHVFIGLGISFCAITCLGHFAAHTAHAHFLSCYIPIIFLLLFLEIALMALDSDWEKDLPEDPTGRFNEFRKFLESNMELCKWVGVLIALAQGVSILLATVIRTLETDIRTYHYRAADSTPLLVNPSVQQLPCDIDGPYFAFAHNSEHIRFHFMC